MISARWRALAQAQASAELARNTTLKAVPARPRLAPESIRQPG
jgi:hypothetical protein